MAVAREGGTATQILIFLWMAGMRVRATEFEMESQAEGGFYLRPQQRVNTFRMSCGVRFSLMTLSSIDSVVKGCVSHCGKSLVLCELVHFHKLLSNHNISIYISLGHLIHDSG